MNVFHLILICFKLNVIFVNVGHYNSYLKNFPTPAPASQYQDLSTKTSTENLTTSTSGPRTRRQCLSIKTSVPIPQHQNYSTKTLVPRPQHRCLSTKATAPKPQHQDLSIKTSASGSLHQGHKKKVDKKLTWYYLHLSNYNFWWSWQLLFQSFAHSMK